MMGAFFARASAADITFPLEARWSSTLPAPPAFAPAFDEEHAYLSLKTTRLVALQLKDGATSWSVDCPMTAPPTAGDGLVFGGSDGLIEARNTVDGRARWRRPVKGTVVSLHWDTGWLIASLDTGPLLALRAADGVILWDRDLGSQLHSPPALAGDRLYLPLNDGRLVAVNLTSGAEIWTTKFSEPVVGLLPVGDRVFVAARDNQLHALEASDGNDDWRWRTGADLIGAPVLDERRVYYVGLDNVLRGHNRNNGTMQWRRVLPMRPFAGPILNGQMIIIAGVASELRAYSTADGSPLGEMIVKGAENEEILLAAPPHLAQQGLVILVTKGGQVRALGSAAPAAPDSPAPAPADTPAAPAP
jgi:outer membrane protein assembly factor BamB